MAKAAQTTHDDAQTDDKVTLVTKEGFKKLEEELKFLKETKRKEVAARIKEAISYGDLSENSEYEEAKNEQAFVEGQILELEDKIKHAKIIQEHHKGVKTVQLGTHVVVENMRKKGEKEEYVIVGSTEADPINHKISNESPVGHALLEKKAGEIVKFQIPAGVAEYKIVKID